MKRLNLLITIIILIAFTLLISATVSSQNFYNDKSLEIIIFEGSGYSDYEYGLINDLAAKSGQLLNDLFNDPQIYDYNINININITRLSGRKATADRLETVIDNLYIDRNTSVLFYTVMHGGYYVSSSGSRIEFIIDVTGKALPIDSIIKKFEYKNAPSTTMIFDTCRVKATFDGKPSLNTLSAGSPMILSLSGNAGGNGSVLSEPELIKKFNRDIKNNRINNYNYIFDLLTRNKGTNIIRSSRINQYSFSAYHGSLYSMAFVSALRKMSIHHSWEEVNRKVYEEVKDLYEELYKSGHFEAYVDDLLEQNQTSQQPKANQIADKRLFDYDKSIEYVYRGYDLLNAGSYKKAENILDEAISQDIYNPYAWAYNGLAKYYLGDKVTAEYALSKAYDIAPNNEHIRYLYFTLGY